LRLDDEEREMVAPAKFCLDTGGRAAVEVDGEALVVRCEYEEPKEIYATVHDDKLRIEDERMRRLLVDYDESAFLVASDAELATAWVGNVRGKKGVEIRFIAEARGIEFRTEPRTRKRDGGDKWSVVLY